MFSWLVLAAFCNAPTQLVSLKVRVGWVHLWQKLETTTTWQVQLICSFEVFLATIVQLYSASTHPLCQKIRQGPAIRYRNFRCRWNMFVWYVSFQLFSPITQTKISDGFLFSLQHFGTKQCQYPLYIPEGRGRAGNIMPVPQHLGWLVNGKFTFYVFNRLCNIFATIKCRPPNVYPWR